MWLGTWWLGGLCCVLPLLSDQTDAGLSPRHRHHAGGADRQQNNGLRIQETERLFEVLSCFISMPDSYM